ncbi:MAG: hypothetical protein HC772_13055, partial [Leptolyngbyaceae cyanobacterium CRU_2_3]|nr:hypothetical protein [Leptolyngbyaceae cyanobacterium CRU_2_3]
ADKWYGGLVSELIRVFGIQTIDFPSWWRQPERSPLPSQRLREFIQDVLLVEFPQKLVIFFDEIDR